MSCFYHRNVSEFASCDRCNRPVCSDCFLTFIHEKSYKSRPNFDDEQRSYKADLLEEQNKEELYWCLPCYYTHFSRELAPQTGFIAITTGALLNAFIIGIMGIFLLFFLINNYFPDLSNNLFSSSLFITSCILVLFFLFYAFFQRKKKDVEEKMTKIEAVKKRFLQITTIGTIDEPITCYYCKFNISPDEFACMNLDCTLGENVDKNAKEVQINAVNEHYGLFTTLTKLPKLPEEKKEK